MNVDGLLDGLADEVADRVVARLAGRLGAAAQPSSIASSIVDRIIDAAGGRAILTVPEAGSWLGLGRTASYRAAEEGDIPTLRVRGKLAVPLPAFLRLFTGGAEDAGDEGAPFVALVDRAAAGGGR